MLKPLTKKCSTCLMDKPLIAFGRCRSRADGFQPQCKACRSELMAEYYRRHRESILPKARENARAPKARECAQKYRAKRKSTQQGRRP